MLQLLVRACVISGAIIAGLVVLVAPTLMADELQRKFAPGISCDEGVESERQDAIEYNRNLDRRSTTTSTCTCGPECQCGDNCRCSEIAKAPPVLLVGATDSKAERAPTFAQRRTLHKNRILIKLALRHSLNQQLKNEDLDADDRARIEAALDDRQTIEALAQYVTDMRSRSLAQAIDSAGDGERPIIEAIAELIRALIPTIIELLKALIPLLVSEPLPGDALLDAPAGWSETSLALAC